MLSFQAKGRMLFVSHDCHVFRCPLRSNHAIARSRGGLSTKINAVVDENGLPVRLLLTAGQAHNLPGAPQLLAGLTCRHVVAVGGYGADALLELIRAAGAKPQIPSTTFNQSL
jgi:hypothetical protein